MAEFKFFKKSIQDRLDFLIENSPSLFEVDLDKDEFYEYYLNAFPQGTNEVFRERRSHDCSCCKQFIRNYGTIVGIIDGKIASIWDVEAEDEYQVVTNAMKELVESLPITDVFFSEFKKLGTNVSRETRGDNTIHTWHHFYYELPGEYVTSAVDTKKSQVRQTKDVIERSLSELTEEACETVIELTEAKNLYRGEEHLPVVNKFLKAMKEFDTLENPHPQSLSNYAWELAIKHGRSLAIRNTAIGTLLINLSEGMDLETAVSKYEKVVAPSNYKRPKTLFLINSSPVKPKMYKHLPETNVETFVKEILPGATELEVLVENNHIPNFFSLIAPVNKGSKSMFKWNNSFSWTYNNDVADSSIKDAVIAQGGKTEGVLRFSLSWAEGNTSDNSDLDAHCHLPNGSIIYYGSKRHYETGGNLDVDIIYPNNYQHKNIVENIIFPNGKKLPKGDYKFLVHGFDIRGVQQGFKAELEFNGEIYEFEYSNAVKRNENVLVAIVNFDGKKFFMKKSLPSHMSNKEVWNVQTMNFVPVNAVMYSPNHWEGESGVGNKHYFFSLEGCKNPDKARGFFNEHLDNDLKPLRKVFEILGSKMSAEPTNDTQISGVGFSSTMKNSVILKVNGKPVKVNFSTTKTN